VRSRARLDDRVAPHQSLNAQPVRLCARMRCRDPSRACRDALHRYEIGAGIVEDEAEHAVRPLHSRPCCEVHPATSRADRVARQCRLIMAVPLRACLATLT
jgi:hypothetical protein